MINPYIMGMFLSVTVASFSQILLKKSAMKTYDSSIREYLNVWVIGGYFLLFCSMLISLWAYGGVDYKNGPVIESLGNVLVPLLSFVFFREKLTKRKIMGVLCIMIGIMVFYSSAVNLCFLLYSFMQFAILKELK